MRVLKLLLTIGKHGNTQPRSCNRKEDLEIGSAEGEGMRFWRMGIQNPAFYALGEDGSQNTTSDSATTLSEREYANASEDDP